MRGGERETERQRDRDRERERERQKEGEREAMEWRRLKQIEKPVPAFPLAALSLSMPGLLLCFT